jgi:hypothetical protein
MRRVILAVGIAVGVAAVAAFVAPVRNTLQYLWGEVRGGYTTAERLEQYGLRVKKRLGPAFEAAGVKYPPRDVAFLVFKDSKVLELYARDDEPPWRFVKAYPVIAASGTLGPKLKEGDRQVPEGVYLLDSLNPNSRFHLSVRLDYPNEFDRRMAQMDGRERLGGDIMIHGGSASVGCLAMGDDTAEDIFIVSALTAGERIRVIISPTDFRTGAGATPIKAPRWVPELYGTLSEELRQFPR